MEEEGDWSSSPQLLLLEASFTGCASIGVIALIGWTGGEAVREVGLPMRGGKLYL